MMKKILMIILIGIVSVFIFFDVWWYYKMDKNNVAVILSNHINMSRNAILDSMISMDIKVFVDDKLIYSNPEFTDLYFSFRENISIGFHKISVVINSKERKEKKIFIFPLRWVYIEYDGVIEEGYDSPFIIIENHYFPPRLN